MGRYLADDYRAPKPAAGSASETQTPEPESTPTGGTALAASPLMAESGIHPYVPPNFEQAFLSCQSFGNEAHELELWLKFSPKRNGYRD